jgi:hypothetical protein
MRSYLPKTPVIALAILVALASTARASLVVSYQFNGNGNWSLDAVGSNNTPVGILQAVVPLGSTVEKAFLYSSNVAGNPTVPAVNFQGVTYAGAAWTNLGTNPSGGGLTAFRTDVTSQVSALVGSGSASTFNFNIFSEVPNGSIDGEALAIVFSNPLEQKRTIAFLDGFSASTGDNTALNLANPLTAAQLADPNFEAFMSLGIGYSHQPSSQFSQVDVNGVRLTTSAGGEDDGGAFNGGLITIGGIGDSAANPLNPFANGSVGPNYDDELYSLKPFLFPSETVINVNTLNPSGDDNIFFAGFNITADAGVNAPPPSNVPDSASTLGLLGGALLVISRFRRKVA